MPSVSVAFKDGPHKPGPAGIRPLKHRRQAEHPSDLDSVPPKEIQRTACHILEAQPSMFDYFKEIKVSADEASSGPRRH